MAHNLANAIWKGAFSMSFVNFNDIISYLSVDSIRELGFVMRGNEPSAVIARWTSVMDAGLVSYCCCGSAACVCNICNRN